MCDVDDGEDRFTFSQLEKMMALTKQLQGDGGVSATDLLKYFADRDAATIPAQPVLTAPAVQAAPTVPLLQEQASVEELLALLARVKNAV
jgi:hypothetical protein